MLPRQATPVPRDPRVTQVLERHHCTGMLAEAPLTVRQEARSPSETWSRADRHGDRLSPCPRFLHLRLGSGGNWFRGDRQGAVKTSVLDTLNRRCLQTPSRRCWSRELWGRQPMEGARSPAWKRPLRSEDSRTQAGIGQHSGKTGSPGDREGRGPCGEGPQRPPWRKEEGNQGNPMLQAEGMGPTPLPWRIGEPSWSRGVPGQNGSGTHSACAAQSRLAA